MRLAPRVADIEPFWVMECAKTADEIARSPACDPRQGGERMIYLNIEEPGLLFTFFDFCDTLDDEIFFTSEEAYRKIHDLIQEYSK